MPAVRGEERPVVRLPRVDVGGQLDREAGPARDVEHLEEAGTLVAVVGLAVEERVLVGPPLRHGRVAAPRLCGAARPRREVHGGPHALPGDVVDGHRRVGGAEILPDGQIDVVTADPEVVLAGPDLKRSGVQVEERGPGEADAQRRRDAGGEVQQQRIARAGGEVHGRRPEVLRAARRVVARAVRKEYEDCAVGDAEPFDVTAEGVDELAVARGVAPRPEQLQPVGVDAEGAQPEEVLERHPEVAAPGRVLRHERGADEDGARHDRRDASPQLARRHVPPNPFLRSFCCVNPIFYVALNRSERIASEG